MKCIIIVESNCSDTTKESEFNEWYNAIHLPDMMELPEIKSACRYENLNPSENDSKYIAVYEIEADDIGKVLERAGKHVEKKAQQGRMSDLFSLTRNSQFMQIYSLEK